MKTEISNAIRSTGKWKNVKVWKIDASDVDPFTGVTTMWIEVSATKIKTKRKRK